MSFQKLFIKNTTGDKLGARLDLPGEREAIAYALFAHCFTCTKNLKAIGHISQALTRQGIAVLRFDFTGLGESEGDFADTNFSSNVADLIAVADFLKTEFEAPKILVGHSLGGAAVLQAANRIPAARAVATIAAPAEPSYLIHLLERKKEAIDAEGTLKITLGGRAFSIKKQFLDDLERTRMQETIRNLRRPLLILHSPLDNTVGIDNATQIFQAARHPKSFISLDQADHLMSNERDSLYAGSVIATWAGKYI
jgi:putative redox protein